MRILYLLICFQVITLSGYAQQLLKGRVTTAENQQPLPGAVITEADSKATTLTNNIGQFSIKLSNGKHKLTIKYLGYKTKEVMVDIPATTELEVLLSIEENQLDEVSVNTGYQTLHKERATGSFVHIDNDLLNRSQSTGIINRLADIVPGLIFNRSNQRPGNQTQISIRGQSTIFSKADPLIVIDNFPYDGDVNNINPNDVESITVLKDAAAASIWGSKAGNGVIVITTKKGKYNEPIKVSINANVSVINKPDQFYQSRMSTADYIDIEKRLFTSGAYNLAETSPFKTALSPVVELLIKGRDNPALATSANADIERLKGYDVRNDYDRYLNRTATNQQYAFNLSGGSDNQGYFVSSGYDHNLANMIGNQYSRVSLNASNTYAMFKNKLELSTGISYIESENVMNNGIIEMIDNVPLYPYAKLKDDDGSSAVVFKNYRDPYLKDVMSLKQGLLDWHYRPLDEIKLADNKTRLKDYRINIGLKYKVIPELYAEILYQYGSTATETRNNLSQETYYTRDQINRLTKVNANGSLTRPVPLGGILNLNTNSSKANKLRGQLNFNKTWLSDHAVSAIAGAEVSDSHTMGNGYRLYGYDKEYASTKIVDYINGFPLYINPNSSNNKIGNVDDVSELTDRFLSYYANAAYTYKGRYTVSGSGRLDRSNLYGVKTNQKGVPLWSAGLSWLLSQESFYKTDFVPYLKLRITYGYNGNVNKSLSAYTTASYTPIAATTRLPFATVINPPNPQLKWERVKIGNLGVDFSLKNNVITGSIDYYQKRGVDLIGDTPFPPSSGVILFRGNTADTKGNGVELALNSVNINTSFKWVSNFLLSTAKDKVTGYSTKSTSTVSLLQNASLIPVEGRTLYGIYSYNWAGLDPLTGDPQGYLDGNVSKDYNKILQAVKPEDLVFQGSSRPTVYGALRNTFSYKGFSLSANISYRLGYYLRKNSIRYVSPLTGAIDYGLYSGHGDYALRWKNPGEERFTQIPSIPSVANANRDNLYLFSQALIAKGDNIRLQDVRLAYDLTKSSRRPFNSVQIFLYASNLGIIWKAEKGALDPDFGTQGLIPDPRSIAAGLRIDF
nr:SusC/RagA family TonB-linked outer membrane protein [Pedobacter panaciterrae]